MNDSINNSVFINGMKIIVNGAVQSGTIVFAPEMVLKPLFYGTQIDASRCAVIRNIGQ